MDRYQKVERRRPEEPIGDNEMRITAQGLIRNYITYATTLLQEKQAKEIVLKAMGQAISKTVAITEILKKRIPGLYQDTLISSTSIVDVWEPIEEGLVPVELTRQVSLITVTLSTTELNQNSSGYQAPSHVEQQNLGNQHQQPHQQQQQRQQRLQQPRQAYFPSAEVIQDSYGGRGRGRDRGRGRGWGRGGYANYQEYGGYYDWGRGGGRGRGWGYRGAGYERDGGRGYERGGGRGYERGAAYETGAGRGYERGGGRDYGTGAGYERGGGRGYERGGGRGYESRGGKSYESGGGRGYERGGGRGYERGGGRGYESRGGRGYESGGGRGYERGGGRGYGRGRGRIGGRGRGGGYREEY